MIKLSDLSFSCVMDLYRTKKKAELNNEQSLLESLKLQYPDLFSDEFADFIYELSIAIDYLDFKYNEDFHSILENSEPDNSSTLH